MKTPDMSAFIGTGFDMEFANKDDSLMMPWSIGELHHINNDSNYPYRLKCHPDSKGFMEFDLCRPRLKKPQVLDDWSWVPDGFVWEAVLVGEKVCESAICNEFIRVLDTEGLRIKQAKWRVVYGACIGVTPEYAEWGLAHGMEVVEV